MQCVETNPGGQRCINNNIYHTDEHEDEFGNRWPGSEQICRKSTLYGVCYRDTEHTEECRDMDYWERKAKVQHEIHRVVSEPDIPEGFDSWEQYRKYLRFLGII